jgi:uncharacterized membrane protein YoaT (DUF817 family)
VVATKVTEVVAVKPSSMRQLSAFFLINAKSCVFPFTLIGVLALSHAVPPGVIPRYDFILFACIAMQLAMLRLGLETLDELKVVGIFHVIGLALELHKTHVGSWAYPEASSLRVGDVPLYSGFMYASVASFMCQAWRRFSLVLENWPHHYLALILAIAVYTNFFLNHWIADLRPFLFLAVLVIFYRTKISFTVLEITRHMPLTLAFALIGSMIWIAENLATYLGAWKYPHQENGWQFVGIEKISSWCLLVIVSFLLVAQLKQLKATLRPQPEA